MACAERGLQVLVLEAGGLRPTPGRPDLLAAEISDPRQHDPTDLVSAFALGGTSHWWGGRAVPFDQSDFQAWPIKADDLRPWYLDAASWLGVEAFHETPAPGAFARLKDFDATRDEVWCPQTNVALRWGRQLRAQSGPAIALNARVLGLLLEGERVAGLRVLSGGEERIVRAPRFVLATGGLGALKLLLLAQRERSGLFGGPDGPLGRGYMGHLTGSIADLVFTDAADNLAFSFRSLSNGVVARRQIRARDETLAHADLNHIAWWLDNASSDNPAHGSAVASAKYLAARAARSIASPGRSGGGAPLKPHLDNVARAPAPAAIGLAQALYLLAKKRVTGRMVQPGDFLRAGENTWYMRYHAEQRPDPDNRVRLAAQGTDSAGLPRLDVQFRFGDADILSVVRAHELLDADLQAAGAGRLHWRGGKEDCAEIVRTYARDGYHQLGGAIMSEGRTRGVVDRRCRTHDLVNLWIASGSVFPSGGQANPTLTIVALARRLAAHLAETAR